MAKKLKPLGDRVIVKRAEGKGTAGLIIIPDSAKEIPLEGTVRAIGPDAAGKGMKVGDKVVFEKYGGHQFNIDGEELLCLDLDHVLAILDE